MLDPNDYPGLDLNNPMVLIEAMDHMWQFRWLDVADDVRSGFATLVAIYWQ